MVKIAIIGAGVIGLTSACRILELIPNSQVTIYADKLSPDTTSDVSAGYWQPYCLSGSQADLVLKWGKETYEFMLKKALSEDGNRYGIQAINAYVIQETQEPEVPIWNKIVSHFKKLDQKEILTVINDSNINFKSGFSFLTTTVVMSKYLPELTKELKQKGVEFHQKKFNDLNQYLNETGKNYDYVINCTGIEAKWFVPDDKMYPVKGHVLRVKAPWVKNVIMIESNQVTYIIPLSDLVVLGGTQQKNSYDLTLEQNELEGILSRCSKLVPSLKDAEIVSKHAGLRPGRTDGVRLEMEVIKGRKVVHNYGHGGSGVTIGWGCATDVAHLISQDLKLTKSKL